MEKQLGGVKFFLLAYMCRQIWKENCKPLKKKYNLAPHEVYIIKFLSSSTKFNSAKYIAELSGMKKGIVSVYIEKMMIGGWLIQREDPEDRRAKKLFLTDKAKSVVYEISKMDEEFHSTMLNGVSKEELDTADAVYEKIYANIKNISENKKIDVQPNRGENEKIS